MSPTFTGGKHLSPASLKRIKVLKFSTVEKFYLNQYVIRRIKEVNWHALGFLSSCKLDMRICHLVPGCLGACGVQLQGGYSCCRNFSQS